MEESRTDWEEFEALSDFDALRQMLAHGVDGVDEHILEEGDAELFEQLEEERRSRDLLRVVLGLDLSKNQFNPLDSLADNGILSNQNRVFARTTVERMQSGLILSSRIGFGELEKRAVNLSYYGDGVDSTEKARVFLAFLLDQRDALVSGSGVQKGGEWLDIGALSLPKRKSTTLGVFRGAMDKVRVPWFSNSLMHRPSVWPGTKLVDLEPRVFKALVQKQVTPGMRTAMAYFHSFEDDQLYAVFELFKKTFTRVLKNVERYDDGVEDHIERHYFDKILKDPSVLSEFMRLMREFMEIRKQLKQLHDEVLHEWGRFDISRVERERLRGEREQSMLADYGLEDEADRRVGIARKSSEIDIDDPKIRLVGTTEEFVGHLRAEVPKFRKRREALTQATKHLAV